MKTKKNKYTPEQIEFLRAGYGPMSLSELTSAFNIKYGLAKNAGQIKRLLFKNRITSGKSGRFETGHQPWNTGTKGMRLTTANRGTYKKGNVPPNRKPLGSERIDSKDGYILIKIAEQDPHTGFPTRYKHKHVHIWENTHSRKVPPGHVVIFADGDKRNFDPPNLMLITRAELVRLNRFGYTDAPAELKPSILSMIKLKCKAFELARSLPNEMPNMPL